MAALIQAAAAEDFPARIVVVVSNRSDAGGLETAKASGVPTVTIESKPFGKDRSAFEAVLQSALEQHRRCCRHFPASTPRVRRCAPG